MKPYFSILVVCLNPGNKLKTTLESIKGQSFHDYEVIIKDGGSADGSIEYVRALQAQRGSSLRVIEKGDTGIYDAMNQAVAEAAGRYVYFLNCGDRFYSEQVLAQMKEFIESRTAGAGKRGEIGIYYGNIYERLTAQVVSSNPHMDAFGCYRNVPCHQACFYSRELLLAHPFEVKYRVRADYEQFLWCFFIGTKQEKVAFAYQDLLIADYEGGGFSETKENRKQSVTEHKEITRKYMSRGQLFYFQAVMVITLAPLRTLLARNAKTAGLYNRAKSLLYRFMGKSS